MAARVDLHTHTYHSGDSSTTPEEFLDAFRASNLESVAITDHMSIAGAMELKEELGSQLIVGQEFRTREGECIGLFLVERVPPGLTFAHASASIREQGGLVYLPHPGDSKRSSVDLHRARALADDGLIDIVESGNSKVADVRMRSLIEQLFADAGVVFASSSDAHVAEAIGSSFSECSSPCATPGELIQQLRTARREWRFVDPPRRWSPRVIPSKKEAHNEHRGPMQR